MAAIEKQLRGAQAAQKENNKAIDDNAKSAKAAQGSLIQMRATLAAMATDYANLSKSERENTASAVQLEAKIKSLTSQISAITSGFDSAQKVGKDFGGSLEDLTAIIGHFTNEYNGLTKEQRENKAVGGVLLDQINNLKTVEEDHRKTVENSRKGVKGYIRDINVLGVNVGSTVDSFKSGASGAGTFAKSLFTTRGALVALTAVPIILLLTSLVALFTRSKDGSELFGRKMAALGAVFDLFLGKLVSFGQAATDAFSKPGEAIVKLGNLIKENLENRLSAIGVILRGDLLNGLLQLATGVENVSGKKTKH